MAVTERRKHEQTQKDFGDGSTTDLTSKYSDPWSHTSEISCGMAQSPGENSQGDRVADEIVRSPHRDISLSIGFRAVQRQNDFK
jgi:hypothetical protein